jgi:hypothetical protein
MEMVVEGVLRAFAVIIQLFAVAVFVVIEAGS